VGDTSLSGVRALVLTISDGVASGARPDESGAVLADRLEAMGATVERDVVPDEQGSIAARISGAAATHQLIVSTGGTGLTPRDVTPQAVRTIIDYEIPGLGEAMRAAGRVSTALADLSRSLGGVRGRALVVCVPGSPRGASESLAAIEPLLAHALETLAGPHDHGRPAGPPATNQTSASPKDDREQEDAD
jgi:molybdenum cofactor synthesis domain-containing protein